MCCRWQWWWVPVAATVGSVATWETVRIWREGRELLRHVCKGCISRVQDSCGCGFSTAFLSIKAMKKGSRLRISWEQFKEP